MAEPTQDRAPEPPTALQRGRRFLIGLLAMLVLVDLLLASVDMGEAGQASGPNEDIESVEQLRAYLDAALASDDDDSEAWLLLGDSVLVGDTGKAELPDWHERRLIDYLEREANERESVRFHQLAFSGQLPVDMLELVEELDARDPDARLSLLVELSPRYFSGAYAKQVEHSRPWLAELDDDAAAWTRWSKAAVGWVRVHAPVYRHRGRFTAARERLELRQQEQPEVSVDPAAARIEGLARVRVHYQKPRLEPSSVQVAALLELVERCRARGRRVALFATPIEDQFIANLQSESERGAYLARLDALLEPDGREVALLPMDHPMFAVQLFWDHVHLRPEGHRLLAINLLHQLGVGLERVPARQQLIANEGLDKTLVARIEPGFEDGASWQASFAKPLALALSPDAERVVIADTNNHVLRELHGDMRIVSTLAGVAGEAGSSDGRGAEARLARPRALAFVGEQLYVADGDGGRLRRLVDGVVQTLAQPDDGWNIATLRAHDGRLYALETKRGGSRIVTLDPETGAPSELVVGDQAAQTRITAFALDPAGKLYLATRAGQILRLASPGAHVVDLAAPPGEPGAALELVFENLGTKVLPQAPGEIFPFAFDKLKLSEISDMVWVERYGGLLVQDLAPQPKRGEYNNHVTERVQLRFFDFDEQLIYPWLKPLVAGIGHFHNNADTGGASSYFHEGALALDQRSAAMFYLERGRSRLLRIDDGLLGVSKTSEIHLRRLGYSSVLGQTAAMRTWEKHKPARWFAQRRLPLGRRGPFSLLVVSSSVMTMSEAPGQYSLGRRLGLGLAFDLALRERIELHVFQRMTAGGSLSKQISRITDFIDRGGRPDLILFESNASLFLSDDDDDDVMVAGLRKLEDLARRSNAALILVDTSPYIVRNRDSLRTIPEPVQRFFELARARGVEVVEVGDRMLDEHLEISPFGTPPMTGTHMSTWAVDAVADQMAVSLSPFVRAELRDRVPACQIPDDAVSKKSVKLLDKVFAEVEHPWAEALPRLPLAALQISYEDAVLRVFIDLGQLGTGEDIDAEDIDELMLACVYELVVRQRYGVRLAEIEVGRFSNYDEYGAGVSEGAQISGRERLEPKGLKKLAKAYAARN